MPQIPFLQEPSHAKQKNWRSQRLACCQCSSSTPLSEDGAPGIQLDPASHTSAHFSCPFAGATGDGKNKRYKGSWLGSITLLID